MQPKLYDGNVITDERGQLKFVNGFKFKGVKRFYEICHTKKAPRAFHAHMKEAKYVYVTSGSILFCVVKLNTTKIPDKRTKIVKFILSSKNPQVLYVPPGYANGFKILEENTKVIFFSNLTLARSLKDDTRYPYDYWGKDIWGK